MEGEIFRLCAAAVLCAVVGAVLGKTVGSLSVDLRLGGLALVFGGVDVLLGSVMEALGEWNFDPSVAKYSSIMLKGLGIAVLCRICSDVCQDCGESTVAAAVESGGKLALVLLASPVVGELISLAADLLDKI